MRRLYSISGNTQRLDGGAMFGNAPKKLWEAWAPPDELNRIELATRSLLVHDENRFILFEAGIGAYMPPELKKRYGVEEDKNLLLEGLDRLGLLHSDISVVVLSHLHFDHVGGLLSDWKEGEDYSLLFPNAKFIVSRAAWERANSPHIRDKSSFIPELNKLLEQSNRLELVEGFSSKTLGKDYRFHFSDGHTPGMLLTEILGDREPLIFGADLIPGRAWVHTSISMGYDRFPELLIDEKRSLLEYLVKERGRVFFTHDPSYAMAHITKDENNRFGSANNKRSIRGFIG